MVKQEKGWGPKPLHGGGVRHGLLPGPTTSHHQQEAQAGGEGAAGDPRAGPGHGQATSQGHSISRTHCSVATTLPVSWSAVKEAGRAPTKQLGWTEPSWPPKKVDSGPPTTRGGGRHHPDVLGRRERPREGTGNADRAGLVTPESTPRPRLRLGPASEPPCSREAEPHSPLQRSQTVSTHTHTHTRLWTVWFTAWVH